MRFSTNPTQAELYAEQVAMLRLKADARHAEMLVIHGTPEDLKNKIIKLYRNKCAHINEPDPHINNSPGPIDQPPRWSAWLFSVGREPNMITYEGEGESLQEALIDLYQIVQDGEQAYRLLIEGERERRSHPEQFAPKGAFKVHPELETVKVT
ncbi:hypothetical protein D6D24_10599 [Aureobasidium pullulans]|uniref:Uncharacterized protein n=1 Tax=Aureobasidium pullulans TaxID=5580 RepID=A0A4S8UZI0_AURPU|nr:hypothetical protein D6D24_10599 [Aureobasidium pullulans]